MSTVGITESIEANMIRNVLLTTPFTGTSPWPPKFHHLMATSNVMETQSTVRKATSKICFNFPVHPGTCSETI